MNTSHRILICGVGSIGERHIANLLTLGFERLAVYRVRHRPYRTLTRAFPVFKDLRQALTRFEPTVVFVTGPTAQHMPVALEAAQAGCHLFIEKPLSHTLDDLDDLQAALGRSGRHAMVGYMLRFHPLLRRVKAWLDEGQQGRLGRPIFARVSWGEHVPDWHPWEDYRTSYAVLPDMGGGPALTLSHELDLLVWFFGAAEHVVGLTNRVSPLEARCEHAVDILARFRGGVTANVHLDYCQRPSQRSWELVCSRGRVAFDHNAGTLSSYGATIGESRPLELSTVPWPETVRVPDGFDRNTMFLDEVRYFFECLEAGRPPAPGIAEAAESVRMALRALESSPA